MIMAIADAIKALIKSNPVSESLINLVIMSNIRRELAKITDLEALDI